MTWLFLCCGLGAAAGSVHSLCVYCISVWARCVCACGNYCDLNAGSAGETGCLLINEWSRWPRVGGSCERTASRSGGQHNTDTWAITNKTSQAVDTSRRHLAWACVCVCVSTGLCVASLKVNKQIYIVLYRTSCDTLRGTPHHVLWSTCISCS